jgi:pimeloyl-ACP methyl ester carboxylesterase
MQLRVPDVRITEAVAVPAVTSGAIRAAHCRVSGVIETEIQFTELLPDTWNGKFFAGGQGGYAGRVENAAETSVNTGYATVGTDTGHQAPAARVIDGSWATGRSDRLENYGHRAIHRTAEVAKAIIKARYGADPQRSYFFGCSNGGRQALMEAQRYPADFDGIVSCAPAYDFSNLGTAFVRNAQVLYPNPSALDRPLVTPDNLRLLETSILDACDALDGVKDNVLGDPRDCRFDVAAIAACPSDTPGASCLTRAQRAAIQTVYAPAVARGETIYPGQPFGGEGQTGGWQTWITGVNQRLFADSGGRQPSAQFGFAIEGFKHIVFERPDWDYTKYDLANWRADTQRFASIVNADNPDLSAFKARGGKLILAHGWADPALNPISTINYYERVKARDASVDTFARLFMMPGVLHCGGGAGPDIVDWFNAIAGWVERGVAPERLLARKVAQDGSVTNARPLCAYPKRAVYSGTGPTTAAESYTCR